MEIKLFGNKNKDMLEKLKDFVSEHKEKKKVLDYLQKYYTISFDESQDIFQDAFILVYNNIKEGKLSVKTLNSSLSTYFIGVCRNKALELLRNNNKYVTTSYEVQNTPHNTFLDEQVEKILLLESENESLQKKKEALVRDIVRDLPSPCDELLWGYYRDGFSMKILADRFNYASENAVKVTKHRCCEKFRNRYNECVKSLF
jgi:RNA polymerase sigma factor (sigma-70 family)